MCNGVFALYNILILSQGSDLFDAWRIRVGNRDRASVKISIQQFL